MGCYAKMNVWNKREIGIPSLYFFSQRQKKIPCKNQPKEEGYLLVWFVATTNSLTRYVYVLSKLFVERNQFSFMRRLIFPTWANQQPTNKFFGIGNSPLLLLCRAEGLLPVMIYLPWSISHTYVLMYSLRFLVVPIFHDVKSYIIFSDKPSSSSLI